MRSLRQSRAIAADGSSFVPHGGAFVSYMSDNSPRRLTLQKDYIVLWRDQFETLNLVSDGEWAVLSDEQIEALQVAFRKVQELM